MIDYKITKYTDEYLHILGKDNRQLIQIIDSKMYWSKKSIQTRKKPVIQEEKLHYNKNYIKGVCKYGLDEDFTILYKEWREERKISKSYKTPFNEASEKRVFNKLGKVTKKIALAMLEKAIEMKWLTLYDLDEREREKILLELSKEKQKEEHKLEGFKNELEKKKAQEFKDKVTEYINNNKGELYLRAKEEVEKKFTLEGVFKETQIKLKMRILASNFLKSQI